MYCIVHDTSVCRYAFADLCTRPSGAADYGAIARVYHTVFITGIPILGTGTRVNAAQTRGQSSHGRCRSLPRQRLNVGGRRAV